MNEKELALKREALIAKEKLLHHGVVAFPTETVMGLAVIFNDKEAYDRLNKVKRRPEDKPYTLMVKSKDEIYKYSVVDERIERVINAFIPGSLTILVPLKEGSVPEYVVHGTHVLGIRVPENRESLAVLEAVDAPLLVPSANRSGETPALTDYEVKQIFGDEIDFVVSGKAQKSLPSTIVDLTGETPKVVRKGPISDEEIFKVWFNQ